MADSEEDLITLEIETKTLKCSRQVLTKNSDYFVAMFQGPFLESKKDTIKLQDVEYTSFNTILKMLWDPELHPDTSDILSVLQTASMLQFLDIIQRCIEQLRESLSVENCLKIWLVTEQLALKEIALEAKLLALLEFENVANTDQFLKLNLQEVCTFLANVNLQVTYEINVFWAAHRWYQQCSEQDEQTIWNLLLCIDFTRVSLENIERNGDKNEFVKYLSTCGKDGLSTADDSLLKIKNIMHRNSNGGPCFLAITVDDKSSASTSFTYQDKFKRKRNYSLIVDPNQRLSVVCLDPKNKNAVKKLMNIPLPHFWELTGFKIVGHKQHLYIFGGEFALGTGKWNTEVYIYDLLRKQWDRKKTEYFRRRHFKVCTCNEKLYVIGGTGPFRVICESITCYNFETGEWTKEGKLPSTNSRQMKCCSYNNQLFIADINNRVAYTYCDTTGKWQRFQIDDKDQVLPQYSGNLYIYAYNSKVFIKDVDRLYELEAQKGPEKNTFKVVTCHELQRLPTRKTALQSKSVLSYDTLYTLYKYRDADGNGSEPFACLEAFNVKAHETTCIFNRKITESWDIDGEKYSLEATLPIFTAFYPDLADCNDVVNAKTAEI